MNGAHQNKIEATDQRFLEGRLTIRCVEARRGHLPTRVEWPGEPSLFVPFAGASQRPAKRVGGGFSSPQAPRRRVDPRKALSQGAVRHRAGAQRADHLFTAAGSVGLGLQFSCRERVAQRVGRPFLHVHLSSPCAKPADLATAVMRQDAASITENTKREFSL